MSEAPKNVCHVDGRHYYYTTIEDLRDQLIADYGKDAPLWIIDKVKEIARNANRKRDLQ